MNEYTLENVYELQEREHKTLYVEYDGIGFHVNLNGLSWSEYTAIVDMFELNDILDIKGN